MSIEKQNIFGIKSMFEIFHNKSVEETRRMTKLMPEAIDETINQSSILHANSPLTKKKIKTNHSIVRTSNIVN